jgi:hypothetical protein
MLGQVISGSDWLSITHTLYEVQIKHFLKTNWWYEKLLHDVNIDVSNGFIIFFDIVNI